MNVYDFRMIDFDIRRLRSLVAIEQHGSVTAAAEAIGYSPSTVSQHIALLQRDIGLELMRRVGRTIELTPAGRALVDGSAGVFAALDRARAAAALADEKVHGTVRVGSFQSAAVAFIPGAVHDVGLRHPDVTVEMCVQETVDSLHQLETGELDVVIDQNYPQAPHRPRAGVDQHDLMEDQIVVVTPDDWDRPRSLGDLRDHPWILPHPDVNICGRMAIERCHDAEFDPDVRFWVSDYLLGLRFAAAGLGVVLISPIVEPVPPAGLAYHQFDPPLVRSITALTRRGVNRPAVVEFVESLRSAAVAVESARAGIA